MDQFSVIGQSIAKHHHFENCDFYEVLADELNGQALPVHHAKLYNNYNFQNDGTSRHFTVLWSVKMKNGALAELGLFFPVVCLIYAFDRTLAEQQRSIVPRDKRESATTTTITTTNNNDNLSGLMCPHHTTHDVMYLFSNRDLLLRLIRSHKTR